MVYTYLELQRITATKRAILDKQYTQTNGDVYVGQADGTLQLLTSANDVLVNSDREFVTEANLVVIDNTSGVNSGNETDSTIGVLINDADTAVPNDTDYVATADNSLLKKISWTNVKAFLKAYFDTIYTGVGLALLKANNLSDLANIQTARANIYLDKRTTVGNADYTILVTDKEIVTSLALTANRTYTLPTGENAGQEFIVADEFQAVGTYTITIGVAVGKYLNKVLNGTVTIVTTGGQYRFFGDGSGNYTYDAGVARLGISQTFTGTNTFNKAILGYASTSGTNTYTATFATPLDAYVTGTVVTLNFGNTNTGASTINISSLGAKNIVTSDGAALTGGELQGIMSLVYNGTSYQILGGSGTSSPASDLFNYYNYI